MLTSPLRALVKEYLKGNFVFKNISHNYIVFYVKVAYFGFLSNALMILVTIFHHKKNGVKLKLIKINISYFVT